MARFRPEKIPPSQITDEALYLNRRRFLASGAALATGVLSSAAVAAPEQAADRLADGDFSDVTPTHWGGDETLTDWDDVTGYNNFYEFGTGKGDPARHAHRLRTRPWSVTVEGEAEDTGTWDFEDLLSQVTLEERIYRLRCVEAWSMVVPWVGFELSQLLKRFRPTSRAKYVEFRTLLDREQMPGQRSRILDWPYREGLRMDEAMHPLTIMAVGVYGRVLPNQNGAPLRLVVPWKYGFKSIKSIVSIRFTEQQPDTSWAMSAPHEYGFYANVNPEVDHPRWSQARERRVGSGLFASRIPTRMFNGYGEHVAHMYRDLDLRRYY